MSGMIGSSCMNCKSKCHGGRWEEVFLIKSTDVVSRYHHLNHYALFGGSYKNGGTVIMKELLSKYGSQED